MSGAWTTRPLDEVCHVEYGTRVVKSRDGGAKYPVYGGGGATFAMDSFNREDRVVIGRFGMSEQCTRFVAGKFFLNDSGLTVSPKDRRSLSQRFIDYWAVANNDRIYALGKGSAQKNLDVDDFRLLPVAYPESTSEQHRIVAILDEAFAAIATAKANAERNIQNSRAVYESERESVLFDVVSDWKPTTIGDEVDLLSGFPFKSSGYTEDPDSVRLLRGDNIVQGRLRWDDAKRWPSSDTAAYSRFQLAVGDVVLAMDRPWVKAGLKHSQIGDDDLPCLLVQRTSRLRGGPALDNRYLKHLLGTQAFSRHLLGVQTGIGVPHISAQQIKDFQFPRPSLPEQRRLVTRLDVCLKHTAQLQAMWTRKLAALDALRSSLLHHAFTGQLSERTTNKTLSGVAM